jgi:tRNA(Ile)-lysidine synthase
MRLRGAEFKVLQHLRDTPVFPSGHGTIHLMLSGGKDSIALLELLHNIISSPSQWSRLSVELFIHHFNHKRRGHESDFDAEHCIDVAKKLGYPIETHLWQEDLELKVNEGENFHALARSWRYETVEKFAVTYSERIGSQFWVIATAHHRRDHAETMLHNLTRGCGMNGLQGLKAWNSRSRLLRPLLWLSTDHLDEYISKKSLGHREDSSNKTLEYTRNRLRHIVLAEMENLNPKVIEHLWALSEDVLKNAEKERSPEPTNKSSELSGAETTWLIDTQEIVEVADLHTFISGAAQGTPLQLTREKLANILSHVRKLTANQNQAERYIFALSGHLSLTVTSKYLEIKVTS